LQVSLTIFQIITIMILDNKSVSIDDLPKLNSEDFIPIESKFRTYLLLRNSLFFIIPFIGIIALHIFSVLADNIWLQYTLYSVVLLLWLYSITIVILGFSHKAYILRNHDIVYKTGFIFRTTTVIPKNRIQHLEIRQGVLLRIFSLSKLVIYTAGGNASDLSISGLKPDVAEKIKEEISRKIATNE